MSDKILTPETVNPTKKKVSHVLNFYLQKRKISVMAGREINFFS